MDPKLVARVYAGGRILIGAALVARPEFVGERWIGPVARQRPVRALARAVGLRDMVIGLIALHTIDHPDVGPRWQATCAALDAGDLLATLAAAPAIPAPAVAGSVAVAGGAALTGLRLSRELKQLAQADAA